MRRGHDFAKANSLNDAPSNLGVWFKWRERSDEGVESAVSVGEGA
jgi:hypothetical protein